MTSFCWKFRPSVLCFDLDRYLGLSRHETTDFYDQDNQRAFQDGVQVLPKCPQSQIRTLQWNIQGWLMHDRKNKNNVHENGSSNDHMIKKQVRHQKGIEETILEVQADVIVLNEYLDGRERGFQQEQLEETLNALNYTHMMCAPVGWPTFMATRLPVQDVREIRLSVDRSAVAMKVSLAPDGKKTHYNNDNNTHPNINGDRVSAKRDDTVWLVGTHLDCTNGRQRRKEMQALLQELFHHIGETHPIILMGDFNQPRQQDYLPEEWLNISRGKDQRGSCHDDGVDQLLQDEQFTCAWDDDEEEESDNGRGSSKKEPQQSKGVNRNWETAKPPSTHWSGHIVDYSYGRNVTALSVSISPVGLSDHRMTVCDWRLT